MIKSWYEARCFKGPTHVKIAYEAGVTDKTVMRWSNGTTVCPVHKRAAVDRAMGIDVDWATYDAQCCKDVPLSAAEPLTQPEPAPTHSPAPLVAPVAPQPPTTPRSAADIEFDELYGVSA